MLGTALCLLYITYPVLSPALPHSVPPQWTAGNNSIFALFPGQIPAEPEATLLAIEQLDDANYQFSIPDTYLVAQLQAIAGARWLSWEYIVRASESLAAELKEQASALVMNPSSFKTTYGNVRLQVDRLRAVDDYPNLVYGDARKALDKIPDVIRYLALYKEIEVKLTWRSGEHVGNIKLLAATREKEPMLASTLPQYNETLDAVKGRALSSASSDNHYFPVPNTPMRVSLYPEEYWTDLDTDDVSQCITMFKTQLSTQPVDSIFTRKVVQAGHVQLNLERLPMQALNTSNGYNIRNGDAMQMLDAFADYLSETDLYVTMFYQVYRKWEYIAVGNLRFLKKAPRFNITSPVKTQSGGPW